MCVKEDSDLSFPYLILCFSSVVIIGTSDQAFVIRKIVHRSSNTVKRHGKTSLDFGMLTTTRVVRTRGLWPRPNRSGILFEEDLVLVGELCGVEDSYKVRRT